MTVPNIDVHTLDAILIAKWRMNVDELIEEHRSSGCEGRLLTAMENDATMFRIELDRISTLSADSRRQAVNAVVATLNIGMYFAAHPKTVSALQALARRRQAKPANEGKKAPSITEIIEKAAKALWRGQPNLTLTETSQQIAKAVAREIARLPRVPQAWRTPNWGDTEAVRLYQDAIRGRLKAIRRRINDIHPG